MTPGGGAEDEPPPFSPKGRAGMMNSAPAPRNGMDEAGPYSGVISPGRR